MFVCPSCKEEVYFPKKSNHWRDSSKGEETEASPLLVNSLSRSFNEDNIELNIFTMFEIIDGYGSSIGFETNYNILDNLKTSFNFSKFSKGNHKSAFNTLSDYSNIKLNIEYYF